MTVCQLHEIHARTPFKPTHQNQLRKSTVASIGAGSLGSAIIDLLARAGVGQFILADPSRFSIENVSRHLGHLPDLGRHKTSLVAERITHINPATQVIAYAEDIFTWPDAVIAERLGQASLIIASTDVRAVQLMAQEWAFRLRKPAVFVGCYEEARGGECFCYDPRWHGACYGCLRGALPRPEVNSELAYTAARNEEDYAGEPGMYAAVCQVASIAAQLAISLLLSDEADSQLGILLQPSSERQLLLIGTALSEGFYRFRRPFDVHFQPLAGRRNGCEICGAAAMKLDSQTRT